jgi:hypothetical protein
VITDFGALLAPYHLAEPGTDPPGAVLAPDSDDELPDGVDLGEVDLASAPGGARTVAGKIDRNWVWRLTLGEGVSVRSGKGPARGDGTRPKVPILDPCRSVALRAIGTDEGFPDVSHHAAIVWVQLARTGRWSAGGAWAWSTEPAPAGDGRSWARPPRRWATVGEVAALLYGPPSADRMAELFAERDADIRAEAQTRPVLTTRGRSR